jgi:hypothetical protein
MALTRRAARLRGLLWATDPFFSNPILARPQPAEAGFAARERHPGAASAAGPTRLPLSRRRVQPRMSGARLS